MKQAKLHGLAAVASSESKLLILGSMPGSASLAIQQYYGNPRNHFWQLLYKLFADSSPEGSYEDHLAFALSHGVAVWDVVASCERQGSLDTAIKRPEANDFVSFYNTYPAINRVFFNGKKAAELYRIQVFPLLASSEWRNLEYATLPSSSPALTMPFRDKLEAWRGLVGQR